MIDPRLTSKFFKANRDRLFKNLSSDVLIVTANGVLQKSSDEAFPFNQDPSFWYLTGINEADLIMVKTKTEEFIIIPSFFVHRQNYIEPLDKVETARMSGIDQILDEKEGWQKLKGILNGKTKYATLSPSPVLLNFHGIYANPARRRLVERVKRLNGKLDIEDIRKQMARLRMVKQPIEIELLQKAIDITVDTLKEVLAKDNLNRYKDTAQIEKDITHGFLARGGSEHSFEPVLASGPHSALIHFSKLGVPLKSGDLIVCDVGSAYSFYKADLTRTVIYGQPTKRQEAVYESVRYVQEEAIKLLKPGINFIEFEDIIDSMIGDQLVKLGLAKRPTKRVIRQYYVAHGHSLGLDTHDSADYRAPLSAGSVITVEPGIYIPKEGIGVRIEDDIQITKNGYKILSSRLPIGLNL